MADSPAAGWPLTRRFEDALVYATQAHEGQRRKESDVPYVAHLLAVCALVLEDGGDEDEAIAALLHDVVEDQGGAGRAAEVRRRFGDRVADIVVACSDTDVRPKPPWRPRKEAYIAHVRTAPDAVRRVSLADKVHNARTILADYRVVGEDLWKRFSAGGDDQIWYYESLVDALRREAGSRLLDELARVVAALKALRAAR
jgi:(p)ppGpp synthase/HD superfamily hydrolase